MSQLQKISSSTFVIVSNGFADGPSQALRDYLLKHKAKRVVTVSHPLVPEGDNKHVVKDYVNGEVREKTYVLPHRPPYTYILDPFVPLRLPRSTVWFGFNNLATLKGIGRRYRGRAGKVIHWAVDFVPDRFGKNTLATKAYNGIDRLVCLKADGRVELSPVGITSRNEYLGIDESRAAPTQVVPMGAWLDRTPKVPESAWKEKKLVYLGHLVERQGVDILIHAVRHLLDDGQKVKVEIVGSGPLEDDLKKLAKKLKVDKNVKFHGFVKDHEDVESILASGALAIAPYRHENNFVQSTDAGKLKAYLGAGLPIVLTDVPNNARDLQKAGAAFVVDEDPKAFAKAIKSLFDDEKKWLKARRAVAQVSKEFDWNNLLQKALRNIGFKP